MWQRIQTLYLAISTIVFAALFFSPLAIAIGPDGQSASISFVDKIPYLCLMISIITAHFFALVLFRNRNLQIRIATIAALLAVGFQIWIAVDYFTAPDGVIYKFTAVLPFVCAVLDALAIKGIASDILIIGSVGRLRTRKKNRKL